MLAENRRLKSKRLQGASPQRTKEHSRNTERELLAQRHEVRRVNGAHLWGVERNDWKRALNQS